MTFSSRLFALTLVGASSLAFYANAQTFNFFLGRTAYAAIGTQAIATGDFNGDGVIDTLAATPFNVSVYPGRATGAFGPPIQTVLKNTCTNSLLAADFNKDGKLDFACLISSGFQVALGNGDGTFSAPVVYSSSGLQSLGAGDFNNDGVVDLVSFTYNSLLVYLGKGGGGFALPITTAITAGALSSIHPADLNGDGFTDIVSTRNNTVPIYIGKGDGSFQLPQIVVPKGSSSADSVTTGDLNKDGKLDIVLAMNAAAVNLPIAHLAILLQTTTGHFTQANIATPNPFEHLELTDLNGDGTLDLAAAAAAGTPSISIFRNSGTGAFSAPAVFDVPVADYRFVNPRGNKVPDIVYTDGNTIALLPNRGNASFIPGIQIDQTKASAPCLTGDFNNDGQSDVACLDSYFITILFGTGNKQQPLGNAVTVQLIGPATAIALGDFNNDGRLDLEAALVDGTLQYVQNQGGGNFTLPAQRSPGGTGLNVIVAADCNGDGKIDLLTSGGNFLAGNGDGTFAQPVVFYTGTFQYLATGDLNGDGKIDAVGIPGGNAAPIILIGQGNGTFASDILTGVNGSYNPVIADLNGDGKPDIVIPAGNFGTTILLNAGGGQFVNAAPIFNDFWPPTVSAAVGDFNADGKPDVIFGLQDSSVWPVTGHGDGSFAQTTTGLSVEDSTSLLTLKLAGTGNTQPSLAAGSSIITVLEPQ